VVKGILGKKVGMTQIFSETGEAIPVTVIEAGPCWVTQVKVPERDGYSAVQLGFEEVKPTRLTRGQMGHLGLLPADEAHPNRRVLEKPLSPLRTLREIRVKPEALPEEGEQITVDVFEAGDRVDIVGLSKGRGFAGTIKRHGFKRQPKTHGQSDRERAPGSIGSMMPQRVFKGMRMAGRMGGQRVTVQNVEVAMVDPERNLLAVRGSAPGPRGGLVVIKEARKQG